MIERGEGVETKPIKTSYSPAAGTSYVTFDNVKVPVENLLGEENKGIHVILSNFNHERWTMVCKSSSPLIPQRFNDNATNNADYTKQAVLSESHE